jgi:hypothetical protein
MDDDILDSLRLIEEEDRRLEELHQLSRSSSLDSTDSTETSLSGSSGSSGSLNQEDSPVFPERTTETCNHRIIENNGYYFCDFCGNEFTGNISYYKTSDVSYSTSRVQREDGDVNTRISYTSIKDDIKFLMLNENVLIDVFETYKKVTENGRKIHRSKLRKSILCACVKHIFDTRQIPCDENELIKQFDIEKKDYSTGFKKLRLKVPETRRCQDDVLICLRNLYRKLGIDKEFFATIENIYRTVKNIKTSDIAQERNEEKKKEETFDEGPIFKDKNAKTIAAVVIYYWLDNEKPNIIDLNNFSLECLIPKYSLHKAYKDCSPLISKVLIK